MSERTCLAREEGRQESEQQQLGTWLDTERAHGHQVLAKHLAWKYAALSIWMRDAYGPAFSEHTVRTLFMGHQLQSSIMPKMTSALQLTDTDFAMSFKAAVRRGIDEILMPQAGEPMQKLGIREMATALDKAMEHMVKKNEETDWVLAGLRRNGFWTR